MDQRRIYDGIYVICIPPTTLRDGDVVVVERKRGQLIERSCKEYSRHNGNIVLSPNSSDSRYQPISYPAEGGQDDEDTSVEIVGRVVSRYDPTDL